MSVKGLTQAIVFRRITTFVLLIAVAGIYAVPLAEALALPGTPDCCANGMCPRMKHEAKPKASDAMPDCPMNDQNAGKSECCKCKASDCGTRSGNAVGIGYFFLQAPAKIFYAVVTSPLARAHSQVAQPLPNVPEAPPPRTQLS